MPQHRDISPRDCESCRKVYAALEDHKEAAPEEWLTTEALGQAAGLGVRATQVHSAHLVAHHLVDVDRRTLLPGRSRMASEPVLPGAVAWAQSVVAPDPTCARCLIALASVGWEGQIHTEELAKAANVSPRSVERHRPHLVAADLVQFRKATRTDPVTGFVTKLADRFTLLSTFAARPLEGRAREAVPARAAALVRRVRWLSGVTADERRFAEQALYFCMYNGWPDEPLLAALDATVDRRVYHPNGYVAKLLRKLPLEYIVPARDAYTGTTGRRMVDCPACRTPYSTERPGRPICGPCRDAGATIPAPGQELTRIPVRTA
ncbi:hypothetical protein ABZW10_32915 [Kitasatospora sp. NPDC004723]|uniref:hypothetical protein n=1 Tax=Kitasatospora sp. NPDC004723 TaxID=3154288 RepID=UPI0033A7A25E